MPNCIISGCLNNTQNNECGLCGIFHPTYCRDCVITDRVHCLKEVSECNARKMGVAELILEALDG